MTLSESYKGNLGMGKREEPTARIQHARHAALSTINDLIYVFDEECRIVFANQAFLDLFGLSLDDITGRPVKEVIEDEQVADRLERDIRHVIDTGETVYSKTSSTSSIGVSGHSEYIFHRYQHGDGIWVVGSSRDVSERLRLSDSLSGTNEQLTDILESINDAFYTLDTNWRFTYVNARAAELLKRHRGGLIGANIWEEFPEVLDTKLYSVYLQAMEDQRPASFEFYYSPLATWFEVHAYPSVEHMSVYFRDITEKILTQQELQASERRLAEAQRIARLGNWEVNLKTNEFTCSDEQYHIFGLSPADGPRDVHDFVRAVHPDDRALIREQRDRVVRHGGGTFDIEYRIYRPDGEERVVHTLAELATDEIGEPCRLIGTVHDVTERKEIERALEEYVRQQSVLSRELQRLNSTLEEQVEQRTLELRQLSENLETLVWERTVELEESRAELAHQAQHDSLTGLPNRTLFEDRLEHAIATAERNGGMVAVLFTDLDGFKLVNDSLGHAAGDYVLKGIGQRLRRLLRRHDTVARHGGDEFVAVLEGIAHPDEALGIALRFLSAVNEPFTIAGRLIRLSASIGVAFYPQDAQNVVLLQRQADTAMYRAKSSGKNDIRFYSPSMNAAAEERLEIASHLTNVLERDELSVHFQPQFSAVNNRVGSVEALLRWNNSTLGSVSPARLIPIAEETGLMVEVGAWVLDESCRWAALWSTMRGEPIRVAVNVSASQMDRDDFISFVADTLDRHQLSPSQLELEITEHSVMNDPERTSARMSNLRQFGVRIAMDDFGLGSSSLGNLVRLPLDTVKIDRAFIRDLEESDAADRVVQAIVALTSGIGLEVVAEGVETSAQLERVIELGCNRIQGFLTGYPASPEAIGELLVQQKKGSVRSV